MPYKVPQPPLPDSGAPLRKQIDVWAKDLHRWAMKVHEEMFEKGDPDPVDPPPVPPFGGK